MYRDQSFVVRLTVEEMNALNKKVKACGMTREAYVRCVLGEKTPVTLPPMEYHDVIRELRAVGNNLNQIAYRAQSLGLLDAPAYRQNAAHIVAVADSLLVATVPQKQ